LTTVGFNLRALRAVFNYALNKGIITDRSTYPFHITKYTIPAGRNIKKALSAEEIRLIRATTNFSSTTAHWARDMWLLSYFCNGLNMSDLFRIKKDQYEDEYITLFRKKTSTTAANALPVIIYVLPEAAAIIKQWSTESDTYLITGLTDNMTEVEKVKAVDQFIHLINKYMKRLAAQLNIKKKCTCYVARHSYAQALKNAGASIEVISEALGHTSIHTTRHYLNSFKKEVIKKANESLL
jgi:integrase